MICCPVKVLQDPQELEAILLLYRKLRPKKVLEIGSLYGGTLWHWIQKSEPGTVIVSVDMIPNNKEHRANRVLALGLQQLLSDAQKRRADGVSRHRRPGRKQTQHRRWELVA